MASGNARPRRASRTAQAAANEDDNNCDSPSTSKYKLKLRKRDAVSYVEPLPFPSPEYSYVGGTPKKKGKQCKTSTPSSHRSLEHQLENIKLESQDSESESDGEIWELSSPKSLKKMDNSKLASEAKEETSRKSLKIRLRKPAVSSTSMSGQTAKPSSSKLKQSDNSTAECVTRSPKELKRLQSCDDSPSKKLLNSIQVKDCRVALVRENIGSPKTPRTPASIKGAASNIKNTPVRSSSRVSAVVRRLDDSLNEASPATPSSSARPGRGKTTPGNYFECRSSESDYMEESESSDSETENNWTDDDEINDTQDEAQASKHEMCLTPLKSKFLENPPLCLTPKVLDAVSKAMNKDFSPRRTPKINNIKNTPTHQSFFTAEKRIKFSTSKSIRKAEELKTKREKKTGPKKPRKGNRQGIDKISSKALPVAPNFSVTKECAKIPLDVEFEIPWVTAHSKEIENLHNEIKMDFPRWLILLREGFNIMLHGYGSKQFVFDAFSAFLGDKYLNVIINGLFTKFNARKFVLDFIESLELTDDVQVVSSSVFNMTEELLQHVGHLDHPPVFLFAMNFDILAVRHGQMLSAISGLARIPFVHLIASSDHINAGFGISPLQNQYLNFVWVDCTTFENYHKELIWNANVFGNANDASNVESSIEHIFKSLTTNAKKAFALLAGLQLKKLKARKKSSGFQGVEFRELLRLCRESFIAHSETTLKALLTEFVDHKLLRYTGKGKNDDNFLIIDLEEAALEKYASN
ncbi:unnamed protein product [Allacma fusca]|uniref:Origin recognition complex subunit 2 n=1 Tax=Allacma fusca TaxID=39272 RepID=A0A8J2MCH9_9HEXA|nr:unnamed protein product [Allacma fusca]